MIAKATLRRSMLRPRMKVMLAQYGVMPVLWALARALLAPRRRRPRPPDLHELSPHLRRDIGLPPEAPHVPQYFELR